MSRFNVINKDPPIALHATHSSFVKWLIMGVVLTNLLVMAMVSFSIYQSREHFEWREDCLIILSFMTLFMLISLTFARLLYNIWRHQQSTHRALYESQERMQALLENMGSGVVVYRVEGQDFIVSTVNRAVERIENVCREDLIGKNIVDVFPGIVEFGLLDVFKRVSKSGMPEHFSTSFYRDDRMAGWRENYVYALPSGEIVTIYNDVTQRKQAEEALHENEMRLRILGDNLPDSYLYEFTYQDGKPRFIYISSGVERIHGLKVDDLMQDASSLFDQIAAEQMPAYFEAEAISQRDMTDFSMDLQIKRTDGERRWIQALSHPRKWENGQIIWDGIVTDITDRHLFEVEINRLAQAVEQNPTGILITDLSGTPLFTNQAYTRITGYQFAEVYQKKQRDLFSSDLSDESFDQALVHLASGKPWTCISKNRHKSGKLYWEQLVVSPVYDDTGAIASYLYLRVDITEAKKAEEELRRYKDHLEEQVQERTAEFVLARDAAEAANRAKSVFLANMSHELRTPLNAILGFSNIMRNDASVSEAQIENLDIINRSGEHLLKLINDVLEMAKIEAGRLQLDNIPFDLGNMVRDVTDMMQIRAQEKGLQLILDQSSAFPRYIKGDEARLRQVLINLIGNAIKFTEQGSVTARLGTKDNQHSHLLIEIEDTGTGMSLEDQKLIFEPFVQVGKYDVHQGTGLGLAITHQFVQLMGGSLSVKSAPDRGSLFLIDLPLETVDALDILGTEDRATGQVIGLAADQPIYRILIVDDQFENQLLLKKLMGVIGFQVKTAENGQEAIKLFQDWQPQLIWMDSRMPEMDGIEATRQIRRLPGGRDVKIVAVTASAFIEQKKELIAAGMDDFIRKPYRFNDIYECLGRLLGVQYVYESPVTDTHTEVLLITSDMMMALPAEYRSQLKEALESLQSDRIEAALAPIEALDVKLYKTLCRSVANFDYPAILNAL